MPGPNLDADRRGKDAPPGRIFDISRGCVDDGPGLRTTIFLKGCRLDCPWCHNIEGKSFDPEISYDTTRCISCKKCRDVCPRDWPFEKTGAWRTGCVVHGKCADVCPSRARRLVGRLYRIDDIVSEVTDESAFFSGTGGGVTFSGGEPLAQPGFLFACTGAFRSRGIHCAVETAGFWPSALVENVVKSFDLVLFDLKHVDPEKFSRAIGRNNDVILRNLKDLLARDVQIEMRIALIPGFNESDPDLTTMARWLKDCEQVPPVRLLPFHRLAVSKQALFDRPYPYAAVVPLPERRISEAAALLAGEGIPVVGEKSGLVPVTA